MRGGDRRDRRQRGASRLREFAGDGGRSRAKHDRRRSRRRAHFAHQRARRCARRLLDRLHDEQRVFI